MFVKHSKKQGLIWELKYQLAIGLLRGIGAGVTAALKVVQSFKKHLHTDYINFCELWFVVITSRDLKKAELNSITSLDTCSVDILIGADHYWGLITGTVSKNGDDGSCPIPVEIAHVKQRDALRDAQSEDHLDESLRAFWDLEFNPMRKPS